MPALCGESVHGADTQRATAGRTGPALSVDRWQWVDDGRQDGLVDSLRHPTAASVS